MKTSPKRRRAWQTKKRPSKTGRKIATRKSAFNLPDGPRHDSNPLRAE